MYDKLIKIGRRRSLFESDQPQLVDLGRAQLEQMLPHRDPMLLLDGITRVDIAHGLVEGRRRVSENDPVFAGHFPGDPVYPGVLLLEMVGQLGICLQHLLDRFPVGTPIVFPKDERPRPLRLLKVEHAMFQGAVRPGDDLTLVAKAVENSDYVSVCVGQALLDSSDPTRGGQVLALAVYEVFMLDPGPEGREDGSS